MTTTTIQTGISQPTISESSIAGSPKRLARIAGLLYLAVGILGAFAFAAVYSAMYVAGDAAATARNLVVERRTGPGRCRRRPDPGDGVGLPGDDPLRSAPAREWLRRPRMVVLVTIGASHQLRQHPVRVPGHAGRNRPGLPAAVGTAGTNALGHADARSPALRLLDRRDLLRPVAGAARVPRLQVRHVSEGPGHRARRRLGSATSSIR